LLPRPPASTLFPYTTLFRSRGDGRRSRARLEPALPRVDRVAAVRDAREGGGATRVGQTAVARASTIDYSDIGARNDGVRRVFDSDRKSTRLNSSHVSISYAV